EPSALSREFRLIDSPSGLLSAAGGKYTTYRSMAECITTEVARRLGCRRVCRTHDLLLDGAPRQPWDRFFTAEVTGLGQRYDVPQATGAPVVTRHGGRIDDVSAYVAAREAREPVTPAEPDVRGELAYQRDHEMAVLPADHLLRRTRLGLFHRELALPSDGSHV